MLIYAAEEIERKKVVKSIFGRVTQALLIKISLDLPLNAQINKPGKRGALPI